MDGAERGQEAQCVATDITKDTRVVVLFQYLVQGRIDIAVTATLTQCGGTRSHVGAWVEALSTLHAEGFLHDVGVQLTRAGQRAIKLAVSSLQVEYATHHILDEGLALLDNEHLLTFIHQSANQLLGQRILRNLQDGVGATFGETLIDVVIANAAGQDAERLVGAFLIYIIR